MLLAFPYYTYVFPLLCTPPADGRASGGKRQLVGHGKAYSMTSFLARMVYGRV